MIKSIPLLTGIIIFTLNANSQEANSFKINSYNEVGITTKIIDKMPLEVSFVHLKDSGISFLLNAGYCNFNFTTVAIVNFANGISYHYNYEAVIVKNYIANSLYLKSGIMLSHAEGHLQKTNFYNSINIIGSIADYSMDIEYNDDIYGHVTQNFKARRYNIATEFESGILVNLFKSKKFIFHSGFSLGLKIINQKPFGDVIKNLDKITTYSPGIGYGDILYVNIFIGLGYRIF